MPEFDDGGSNEDIVKRPKPAPKRLKKKVRPAFYERSYAVVSYFLYTLDLVYAVFYLGYIFRVQADTKLLMNFLPVKEYMGFNSYSLLTPLLTIVLAIVLGYTTKLRVRLSDGDFFGIIGVILFLACISLHDGVEIQRLKLHKTKVLSKTPEGTEWEKAWSTKPSCLRSASDTEIKHNDDPIPSDAILDTIDDSLPSVITYASTTIATIPALTASSVPQILGDPNCTGFHSKEPVERPRIWMQALQKDLKCCGPYENVTRWKLLVKEPLCETETKGCGGPFIEYVNKIFDRTQTIMFIQAALLFATIVLYVTHFAIMKKEKVTVTKAFSLLRVTSQTVLHGYQDIHREHHLQYQHYHQLLYYPAHPHYHRHVKKRRLQSLVADHKDISQPPRMDAFVNFQNTDEDHKELESLFLSRSVSNSIRMFPRTDSDTPEFPIVRKRGHSISRRQNKSVAETKLKAQLRASKAIALEAAKNASITTLPSPQPAEPENAKRRKSVLQKLGF